MPDEFLNESEARFRVRPGHATGGHVVIDNLIHEGVAVGSEEFVRGVADGLNQVTDPDIDPRELHTTEFAKIEDPEQLRKIAQHLAVLLRRTIEPDPEHKDTAG